MLVMFSGICYRTQEKEIKRKLQCKVQKLTNLFFTLQYTCIDKNEARLKRGILYVLIFTLMGKL